MSLEQAEHVAGLGLLFLLLALLEVCNQLLMSLPSHSLFLSPVIVITWSLSLSCPPWVAQLCLPACSEHEKRP